MTHAARRDETLSTPLVTTLYVLGSAIATALVAALAAVLQAVPLAAVSGVEQFGVAIVHALELCVWLWPITIVGAAVGGIVAKSEELRPQTGMLAVVIGAAVGALAATQVMAPASALSHELAAWAVIAPAGALLLAILPWPGAFIRDVPPID